MLKVSVFMVLAFLSSCVYLTSWNRVMSGWIGEDISEILQLWGEPDSVRQHEDGKVYEYHRKKVDPSCIHSWVVDDDGTIVDFYYEGYCRPIG